MGVEGAGGGPCFCRDSVGEGRQVYLADAHAASCFESRRGLESTPNTPASTQLRTERRSDAWKALSSRHVTQASRAREVARETAAQVHFVEKARKSSFYIEMVSGLRALPQRGNVTLQRDPRELLQIRVRGARRAGVHLCRAVSEAPLVTQLSFNCREASTR